MQNNMQDKREWWGKVADLYKVVREGLSAKVEFEKRLEASEGACGSPEEDNSRWRNIKYKSAEAKVCLMLDILEEKQGVYRNSRAD